jgi:hypothetical protein
VPAVALLGLALSCGYHVGGRADLIPKDVRIIAVPAFQNLTTRYKLADKLSAALTREFLSRTRYQVVADPAHADATLRGAVVNYLSYPIVFDPKTSRASTVQANVTLSLTMVDRAGKVLYTRPNLEVRERYEISVDQRAYFEESESAMDRLSRDVARAVVSSVLENF